MRWKLTLEARSAGLVAILFLVAFASGLIGVWVTRFEGDVASVWIANALVAGVLLRLPQHRWPPLLVAAFAASTLVNLLSGDGWLLSLALASFDLLQVLLVALPLSRRFGTDIDLSEPRAFGMFLINGGLIAPLFTALAASTCTSLASGASVAPIFMRWFLADSIGLLIVTPLVLALSRRRLVRVHRRDWIEAGSLALLTAIATTLIFSSDLSFMFAIMPVLVLCAMRLSGLGVTGILVMVAGIAVIFTLNGLGPIASSGAPDAVMVLQLQGFIAISLLVTLPVNAVIAERARLNDALVRAERARREAAEAGSAARSRFLAAMSHEIRTPLTGVLGMIELLSDRPDEQERSRYLKAMKQSAEMLTSVLNGILDFSRLESGRLEIASVNFDLPDVVRNCVAMFQNVASSKGHEIVVDIDDHGRAGVRGDPIRIQQVLNNLLSNAVKFTASGQVEVRVRASGRSKAKQHWRFEVTDTGIGIAKSDQARLFEPFVQAGEGKYGGTGLGLAISRKLVEAMGGTMGVLSREGHGSTFWFTLELPVAQTPIKAAGPAAAPQGIRRPLHVLIAEDNAINQLLIAALVRKLGYRSTSVENGRRAFEAAEAVGFDCILMDMQMPEMDGVAATRAIRSSNGPNRGTPIIALTADAAMERRDIYADIGLTEFLTKPVDIEALARTLGRIAASAPLMRPAVSAITSSAAFDTERVAELRQIIKPLRWNEAIEMLRVELTDAPATMRSVAASGDFDQLRAKAHGFKGAVANFGATGVARAAKAVELALPGTELELALGRLEEEARHAAAAVDDLLFQTQRKSA